MTTSGENNRCVLSIGGLDPSGGAGIIADVLSIRQMGAYPMAVATSITFQSSRGVSGRYDLSPGVVLRQISEIFEVCAPDAIKIGMLGYAGNVSLVSEFLDLNFNGWVVVDPVFRSSSGASLIDDDGISVFREKAIAASSLLTPNVREISTICGFPVTEIADVKTACLYLERLGAKSVLVTGVRKEKGGSSEALDILYDGGEFQIFSSPWIDDFRVRGTGCRLSSAIAAGLARGESLKNAVVKGRRYLRNEVERLKSSDFGVLENGGQVLQ